MRVCRHTAPSTHASNGESAAMPASAATVGVKFGALGANRFVRPPNSIQMTERKMELVDLVVSLSRPPPL